MDQDLQKLAEQERAKDIAEFSFVKTVVYEIVSSLACAIIGFVIIQYSGWDNPSAPSWSIYIFVLGFALLIFAILLFTLAIYHALNKDIDSIVKNHPGSAFLFLPPLFILLYFLNRNRKRS